MLSSPLRFFVLITALITPLPLRLLPDIARHDTSLPPWLLILLGFATLSHFRCYAVLLILRDYIFAMPLITYAIAALRRFLSMLMLAFAAAAAYAVFFAAFATADVFFRHYFLSQRFCCYCHAALAAASLCCC